MVNIQYKESFKKTRDCQGRIDPAKKATYMLSIHHSVSLAVKCAGAYKETTTSPVLAHKDTKNTIDIQPLPLIYFNTREGLLSIRKKVDVLLIPRLRA